jgi:NAD(P)-dependent dehydrogenase (short-subunit alcohol dehydrogenase family)
MFQNVKYDFTGKRVLVVGGSRGIGKGVVEAFLKAGAEVTYFSRSSGEIPNTRFLKVDLESEEEIEEALKESGEVDILVNVAGINFTHKIEDISAEEWSSVLDVNLKSFFLISKHVVRGMKERRYGKIVNVSSIAGRHRSPVSGVHYVGSKAGIIGFSKQLAFEVAPFGINVNVLSPSQTKTDMLMESMTAEELKNLEEKIPLQRLAEVDDQVGPILFLASDASSYITGSIIDVNGGQI